MQKIKINNKEVTFKNNAPFINCVSKIDGVKIDNAEDLDIGLDIYGYLDIWLSII